MTEPGARATGGADARARVRAALATPVDVAWLASFRILFGLTMSVSMLRFLLYGWIEPLWLEPRFHFKYWGFSWVEPLSGPAMYGLFWTLFGLALAVALGFCFRLAALCFVLGFTYLQLIDVTTYLNHYYLAGLLGLLLLLSPAARAWSIDALLRPSIRVTQVPRFYLWLFRFQVATVYTFAGLAKLSVDWLVHAQPLRIWLAARTDTPILGPLFTLPGAPLVMSWAGFLFDLTIPWLLLMPRVRPYAYVLALGFHALTRLLFPIGMFPVIMVLAALVFFAPEWPRRLLWRVKRAPPPGPVAAREGPRAALPSGWAIGLAGLYCALQLILPLRFVAYGGDVRWHEQGMRFSWRVMVREKNGAIVYQVHSKKLGRSWTVNPDRYLTRLQERELSGQPDLILQLAHHIAREFEQRGMGPVEVKVESLVSLNGRTSVPMVDPEVDLTTVRDGHARATWILPAPERAPIAVTPI